MDNSNQPQTPATPPKVRYAKQAILEKVAKAKAEIGTFSVTQLERVTVSEHCQLCGSPRMKNVYVVKDQAGKTWRIGKSCLKELFDGKIPADLQYDKPFQVAGGTSGSIQAAVPNPPGNGPKEAVVIPGEDLAASLPSKEEILKREAEAQGLPTGELSFIQDGKIMPAGVPLAPVAYLDALLGTETPKAKVG